MCSVMFAICFKYLHSSVWIEERNAVFNECISLSRLSDEQIQLSNARAFIYRTVFVRKTRDEKDDALKIPLMHQAFVDFRFTELIKF